MTLHTSLSTHPPTSYILTESVRPVTGTLPVIFMAARDASDMALADREHQVSADRHDGGASRAANANRRLDASQAAFIFEPSDVADEPPRPAKRRRVSQKHASADATTTTTAAPRRFQPLLGGAENDECVRLRQQLFNETWSRVDSRIHVGDALPSSCLPLVSFALLSLADRSIQSVFSGRPTNPPSRK